MSKSVKLLHGRLRMPKMVIYFYDGMLYANDGIVEIPADRPQWIKRAWLKGYNHTPDGERLWSFVALEHEVAKQTRDSASQPKQPRSKVVVAEDETAKSAEGEDESFDSGRQPEGEDGLRQGELRSSESVSI